MNILFAVSECAPFIKSGGLADVAGALPKELNKQGFDVRVVLPLYGQIADEFKSKMWFKQAIAVRLGWREVHCGIFDLIHDGIHYYFIDNEFYFNRGWLYGHDDDGERYSFFSRAVLDIIPHIDFVPNVIHSHDWHTGMVGYLLKEQFQFNPLYQNIKSMFTIHNIQFQGIFPRSVMHDLLMFDDSHFHPDRLEFFGGTINFMKAGLIAAYKITTVSETYKYEIQDPFFGYQLDGLLSGLEYKTAGIVNGIDTSVYHPAVDVHIAKNYDVATIEKKAVNKKALQTEFGLPARGDVPIVAMITRLSEQKGLSLVKRVFDELINRDVQFILLGSGEEEFESFFAHMEHTYPEKVRAYIGFNEAIAHRIYAGADLFLMPSLFEPCGLSQLISMAYGTLPLVRETGGLKDTVEPFNEFDNTGTGFTFANYNAHEMLEVYHWALDFYGTDAWTGLIQRAMTTDFSWERSASSYGQIYREIVAY